MWLGNDVPAEPHQLPLLPAEQDPDEMSLHQFIESKTRLFLVLEIPRIAESQNDQGLEGTLEQRKKKKPNCKAKNPEHVSLTHL